MKRGVYAQPKRNPITRCRHGREAMNQAASGVPDQIDATSAKVSPSTARRIFEQIWGDVRSSALLETAWRLLGRRSVQFPLLRCLTVNAGLTPRPGGQLPFPASSPAY